MRYSLKSGVLTKHVPYPWQDNRMPNSKHWPLCRDQREWKQSSHSVQYKHKRRIMEVLSNTGDAITNNSSLVKELPSPSASASSIKVQRSFSASSNWERPSANLARLLTIMSSILPMNRFRSWWSWTRRGKRWRYLVSNAGIRKKRGWKAPSFKSEYSFTQSLFLSPIASALYSAKELLTYIFMLQWLWHHVPNPAEVIASKPKRSNKSETSTSLGFFSISTNNFCTKPPKILTGIALWNAGLDAYFAPKGVRNEASSK